MGTVYLAEQKAPVRRRVALKLIKLGMDSKAVLARFELERQALAVMNHDAIAKVFDCGTSERGQPFFVMELVEGTEQQALQAVRAETIQRHPDSLLQPRRMRPICGPSADSGSGPTPSCLVAWNFGLQSRP